MKTFFRRIKDWSNANQGLLALFAVIIALIGIIPFKEINISASNLTLDAVLASLTYSVHIPIYLLLVIVFGAGLFAFFIARKRPRSAPFAGKILIGTWRNDWGTPPRAGFEIAEITEEGKYLVNRKHVFDIHDFYHDRGSRQIRFTKGGIGNDYRKLTNILRVESDQMLVGKELNHPIRYSKLK